MPRMEKSSEPDLTWNRVRRRAVIPGLTVLALSEAKCDEVHALERFIIASLI